MIVAEVERHKQGQFGEVFQAIRRAVAGEHDVNVDAIVLIRAGSVPKTSSGKIKRHACRQGYIDGTLDVVSQWQSGEAESPVAAPAVPSVKAAAPTLAEMAAGGHTATNGHRVTGALGSDTNEPPRHPHSDRESTNGDLKEHRAERSERAPPTVAERRQVEQIVIEEIRRVAKELANGLTLDTPIAESGMDSLERMEILATLEERFGGRFPPEILIDLETTRLVIDAVVKYLGVQPRAATAPSGSAVRTETPPDAYRFDQFPEYKQLRQRLDMLEFSGVGNPYFGVHEGITNDRTIIDGRELINFASYNYVGTSGDPAVSAAAKAAVDRYGTSVSASRVASGEKVIHGELERAIAGFLGTEAALVFVGGHATNESVIGHVAGPGDLVLHDALAHNSIVEGALLSGARRRPFNHNDWQAADRLLEQYRHEYRRVLLAIEGVYSMDGDFPTCRDSSKSASGTRFS